MNNASVAYRFYEEHESHDDFYRDVVSGLSRTPRRIPPKYFYDEQGSRLFESICAEPEYYPAVTEFAILRENSVEIAQRAGQGRILIEPGCGNCEKVRELLNTLRPVMYVPVDISCKHLQSAAAGIAADYGWLDVHAVYADITGSMGLPDLGNSADRLVFYPGSSIGNFEPDDAVAFMARLAAIAGNNGMLLIGVDLVKDHRILNAAYNDANGVTAEFNLNLLQRINRELDANFDVDAFYHKAFFNSVESRIEMHLVSRRRQSVRINGNSFHFSSGDSIHTENSYKYTPTSFASLAYEAGFTVIDNWTDQNGMFGLYLLEVVA